MWTGDISVPRSQSDIPIITPPEAPKLDVSYLSTEYEHLVYTLAPTEVQHSLAEVLTMTAHVDLRVSTLFNFSNHIALITGGASGLGEMAAQALVQNDARVIIASRKESELKRVCVVSVSIRQFHIC